MTLHPGRRITLRRPDGTLSFDGVTTDRGRPTGGMSDRPHVHRRTTAAAHLPAERPRPPTTVDEVVEGLQLALDDVLARPP